MYAWAYFWALYSVPLIYMFLAPVPYWWYPVCCNLLRSTLTKCGSWKRRSINKQRKTYQPPGLSMLFIFRSTPAAVDRAEAWLWGATLRPRLGAETKRAKLRRHKSSWEELPHIQGAVAGPRRRAERRYSTFKVRRGSHEEILLVQGKQQRLHFAAGAVKRYPTCKVREPK